MSESPLPCRDPKPWAWNVVESAKWSSWKQLETLSSVEAMRLFVKVVDDEQVGLSTKILCYVLQHRLCKHFGEPFKSHGPEHSCRLLTLMTCM